MCASLHYKYKYILMDEIGSAVIQTSYFIHIFLSFVYSNCIRYAQFVRATKNSNSRWIIFGVRTYVPCRTLTNKKWKDKQKQCDGFVRPLHSWFFWFDFSRDDWLWYEQNIIHYSLLMISFATDTSNIDDQSILSRSFLDCVST